MSSRVGIPVQTKPIRMAECQQIEVAIAAIREFVYENGMTGHQVEVVFNMGLAAYRIFEMAPKQ